MASTLFHFNESIINIGQTIDWSLHQRVAHLTYASQTHNAPVQCAKITCVFEVPNGGIKSHMLQNTTSGKVNAAAVLATIMDLWIIIMPLWFGGRTHKQQSNPFRSLSYERLSFERVGGVTDHYYNAPNNGSIALGMTLAKQEIGTTTIPWVGRGM